MPSINRVVMQKTSRKWLEELPLAEMDAAEISGKHGRRYTFKSYKIFRYPKHDICDGPFLNHKGDILQYDLILANQVWEHLDRPYAATLNVLDMLRPGGYFWIAVPFYIPFHGAPVDCSRWSARGLKNLLIEAGFARDSMRRALRATVFGPPNGAIARPRCGIWKLLGRRLTSPRAMSWKTIRTFRYAPGRWRRKPIRTDKTCHQSALKLHVLAMFAIFSWNPKRSQLCVAHHGGMSRWPS